jgi:hypothetical protein
MLPSNLVANVGRQRFSGEQTGNNAVLHRVMTNVWKTRQVRKYVNQKTDFVKPRMIPSCRKAIKQVYQLFKVPMLINQSRNDLFHAILLPVVLCSDVLGNKWPLQGCRSARTCVPEQGVSFR